jgi:hypothetical protein
VQANLISAEANGAFEPDGSLFKATPEEIADDMAALAADCENYSADMLLPYVREWLDER